MNLAFARGTLAPASTPLYLFSKLTNAFARRRGFLSRISVVESDFGRK
jgi:hypothetical protein